MNDKSRGIGMLEGMRCPKCGAFDNFLITAEVDLDVTPAESVQFGDDPCWEDHSPCTCFGCDYYGVVSDFKESVK